jgi:hypothetical protein
LSRKSVIYALNMKKTVFGSLLTSLLCLSLVQNVCAQEDSLPVKKSENSSGYVGLDDWIHDKRGIYSLGGAGTQGFAIGTQNYAGYKHLTRLGGGANFSGEHKIWRYVGLGWQIGINGYSYMWYGGIDIPLAIKCNVHILDAVDSDLSDKLDVYAGISIGAGPGFISIDNYNPGIFAVIHVGPQAGIRYWVGERIALFCEVGWGATFVNGGITF